MYASPSRKGYASTQNRDKIEALINCTKRRGFLHSEHPSAACITVKADDAFFHAICMNSNHVQSRLLPPSRALNISIIRRTRAHNLSLLPKDERNFLSRNLYRSIY